MAVRFLLIAIDDERPLGPQLKAARGFGKLPWKLLATLTGGLSTRQLQRLEEMSCFCDRQAVRRGITNAPHELACEPMGDGDAG